MCTVIFYISVGLIKISICLFHRRLTADTSRRWDLLNNGFLALLAVYVLVSAFLLGFQCNPPAAGFSPLESGKLAQPATCVDFVSMVVPLSITHVIMDFCLLVPPLFVLWRVRLPRATKVRLSVVFSTGTISCVGSVLRQIKQSSISLDSTCKSLDSLFLC